MGKAKMWKSLIEKLFNRKKNISVAIILTIIATSFFIQMNFIESEQKLVLASFANPQPVIKLTIPPKPEVVKDNSPKTSDKSTDEVFLSKQPESAKIAQPVKIVQKEPRRQLESASGQNPLKKEAKRDAKSERLRRAEKILTGF